MHAFLSSADFFKIKFLEMLSECQIVLIQIRPTFNHVIWVQTICKGHQQMALVDKELIPILRVSTFLMLLCYPAK